MGGPCDGAIGMTEDEVIAELRARIAAAGSLRALAREWGVSPTWVSLVANGKSAIGQSLLTPMGITKRFIYERNQT